MKLNSKNIIKDKVTEVRDLCHNILWGNNLRENPHLIELLSKIEIECNKYLTEQNTQNENTKDKLPPQRFA